MFLKILSRFKQFNLLLGKLAGWLVVIIMLSISLNVILRYIFRAPISWPIEMGEYVMVALVFLSGALTLQQGRHVELDMATNLLSPKGKSIMGAFTSVLALIYCSVLTWQSAELASDVYEGWWLSETGSEFPLFPVYVLIPIGTGLLCLAIVGVLIEHLMRIAGKEIKEGKYIEGIIVEDFP